MDYKWLRERNMYTGQIEKCNPEIDFPIGWWDAFGEMMMSELDTVIKQENLEDKFCVLQIKEKFGGLRFYYTPSNPHIDEVINKYEQLSTHVCIQCGRPDVPMLRLSWVSPYCKHCYESTHYNGKEEYEDLIIGEKNMPDIMSYRIYNQDVPGISYRDTSYNIKETADKIRMRFENRKKQGGFYE